MVLYLFLIIKVVYILINKTGTILWILNISGFDAQLNIGLDGTIYTVSTDRNLTAISPIGTILGKNSMVIFMVAVIFRLLRREYNIHNG